MRYMAVLPLFCATVANAQTVTEMTPERIREAVAFGTAQKERPAYVIRKPGFVGSLYKPILGYFSTPFIRVAQAAYNAKREYRQFAEADVTAEMIAPELRVYGMAQAAGPAVANVKTIVIIPKGHAADVIRPTGVTEIPVEFRNAMGMQGTGAGLMAIFPLDALRDGHEIHIVYDTGVPDGGKTKLCEDCAVEFRLGQVR